MSLVLKRVQIVQSCAQVVVVVVIVVAVAVAIAVVAVAVSVLEADGAKVVMDWGFDGLKVVVVGIVDAVVVVLVVVVVDLEGWSFGDEIDCFEAALLNAVVIVSEGEIAGAVDGGLVAAAAAVAFDVRQPSVHRYHRGSASY